MTNRRRSLALSLTAALLLGGCSGPAPVETPPPTPTPAPTADAAREERLTLPCRSADGFHPITGENRLNLTLTPLLYQSLFTLDARFQPRRELCAGYTVSEDGLVWDIQLETAVFSDGAALTATDVVNSLNRARQSARYAARLADVRGVAAREEGVRITLARPNTALPTLLDIPIVRESEDPLRPLGTGKYVLEETAGELRLVARVPADGEPKEIALRPMEGADELVYAFDAGEISLVDADLTGTGAPGYAARIETADYPTTTLLYVGCNTASGVCADQRVRQAVARAADREEIARTVLEGHAVASALPIHPASPYYSADLARQWSRDAAAAEALLEQAGWSREGEDARKRRGAQLTFRLIVNRDNAFKVAAARALAEELEALGCAVTLDVLPWGEFTQALKQGKFDLYLAETALTPDFDLSPLLSAGGAVNYTGSSDPAVDALLAQSRSAGETERETTLVNLCAAVVERSPIIPLCFKNGSVIAQWGRLKGLAPTPGNAFAGMVDQTVGAGG